MDKTPSPPVSQFHIQILNNTLMKILCELRNIKFQQQDIINIINKIEPREWVIVNNK